MADSFLGLLGWKATQDLMEAKKKVLFVTSSLNLGGAERQLLLLCRKLESRVELQVISLDSDGPLKKKYLDSLPDTLFLKKGIWLRQLFELTKIIRISKPDVVITWLYKADLLGGIAAKLAGNFPVVWSARNSALPHFLISKRIVLSVFSRLVPKIIIANGKPAFDFHLSLGYPTKKMRIIPNMLAPWTSNTRSNSRLLMKNTSIGKLRIGIAARQVSGKGILESIKTFDDHSDQLPSIDLTIIGQSTEESEAWFSKGKYKGHLVSSVTADEELAEWFQGLDLYLMSSIAWESQPNSLLEAITIGCPVLVSDFVDLDFDLPDYNKYDASSAMNLVFAIQAYGVVEKSEIIKTVDEMKKKIDLIYDEGSILEKWLEITKL